jgi:hypothetical protein
MKKFAIALIPLALVAGAAVAQSQGIEDVRTKLQAAGYTEIRDVEFDSGLWEAEVRRADGRWGEVALDPSSNEVFDAKDGRALIDARGVADALEAAGYTEVSDLDRDGALWEAEARGPDGQRVELRLSGHDGRVLHSDVEYDD